ncbi:MAG: hypothetical protein HY582_01395 [Candidatus Omnitrophica bacterium]|nr:hypothetical protein [Candidatus Omnitrophota bacterium]
MMGVSNRIFSILVMITMALLIYVHGQISVFRVSYSIQKKEKELARLSDDFKMLKFEVSQLRSLSYLDKKMKEMNLKLVMPAEVKVISVPIEKQVDRTMLSPTIVQKGFFSFVDFVKEAQAKTSR